MIFSSGETYFYSIFFLSKKYVFYAQRLLTYLPPSIRAKRLGVAIVSLVRYLLAIITDPSFRPLLNGQSSCMSSARFWASTTTTTKTTIIIMMYRRGVRSKKSSNFAARRRRRVRMGSLCCLPRRVRRPWRQQRVARACACDRATAYESRGGVHSCSPDFRGDGRSMAAETYPCATVRAYIARVFIFIITVVDATVVVAMVMVDIVVATFLKRDPR